MKLTTSKGGRAENARPKKRKWPLVLFICMLPFAALAVFWFGTVRLPAKPWEIPNGLVTDGNEQTLPNGSENAAHPQGTSDNQAERQKGVYTFLLCGLDEDKTRTDTIMVASLDITKHTLGLVSIPRDTYIPSASRSVKKINGAYGGKNIDRLLSEVKTIVGFRPDYWVMVDYNGFVQLVDAVKGVEFYVPTTLRVNTYQSVTRVIPEGMQHLNGIDALGVARHRHNYSTQDLQRTSVQRDLLKAIAKKMLTPASLLNIQQLKDAVVNNLETELAWGEITALAWELSKVDMETGFTGGLIPTSTKSGSSYEQIKTKEALEMINSTINPYGRQITEEDLG